MSLNDWPIILAKISVDFVAQIYFGEDVVIRTGIEKVGNTSVIVKHEAWQRDKLVARGDAVMVYFDYQSNKPTPIPSSVRERLEPIMIQT